MFGYLVKSLLLCVLNDVRFELLIVLLEVLQGIRDLTSRTDLLVQTSIHRERLRMSTTHYESGAIYGTLILHRLVSLGTPSDW